MKAGADCARIALSALISSLIFSTEYNLEERVRSALEAANRMVFERFRGKGGTTISAIITNLLLGKIKEPKGKKRITDYLRRYTLAT